MTTHLSVVGLRGHIHFVEEHAHVGETLVEAPGVHVPVRVKVKVKVRVQGLDPGKVSGLVSVLV